MKHIPIILAFATIFFSAIPYNALAQTAKPYAIVNKSIKSYDYTTHSGVLALESYITEEGQTRKSTLIEGDFCLVLDYSSSMKNNDKGKKLQIAANAFIDSLAKKSNVTKYSRVGIVTFGTGAHMKTDFIAVNNSANVTTLHNIIGQKCPADKENSTRYDLAFWIASNMFYAGQGGAVVVSSPDDKNKDRDKVVDINLQDDSNLVGNNNTYSTGNIDTYPKIKGTNWKTGITFSNNFVGVRSEKPLYIIFLTDGQPTGGSSLGDFTSFYSGSSSGIKTDDTPGNGGDDGSRYDTNPGNASQYNFGVANYAIKIARDLKKNKNVKIFCINLVSGSNTGIKNFAEDCLRAISSEYPDATRYRQKFWGTKTSDQENYYQSISGTDQASISRAFNAIQESSISVETVQYDATTVIKDVINNLYFKLPDNATVSSINVYAHKCTGIDTDGVTCKFLDTGTKLDSVSVVISKKDGDSYEQVIVSGFDYSKNWCGLVDASTPHGNKLVVNIPFKFDGINKDNGFGTFATNYSGSTLIPPAVTGDQPIPFISPNLYFAAIKVTRKDLQLGESAVYTVKKGDSVVATFSLTGTSADGTQDVSQSIFWLPAGDYTVTETAWDWAYKKSDNPQVKSVSANVITEYVFEGKHNTGTVDDSKDFVKEHNHAEAKVKNDFKDNTHTTNKTQ